MQLDVASWGVMGFTSVVQPIAWLGSYPEAKSGAAKANEYIGTHGVSLECLLLASRLLRRKILAEMQNGKI